MALRTGCCLKDFMDRDGVILDVRSPSEWAHAHLPGSVNLPLFSDEERAKVGTCYKQEGREKAIELGIEIAGPKAGALLREARSLCEEHFPKQPVARVHCWRGGMRSGAVATLLSTAGIKCSLLRGGYKAFRRWCLKTLEEPRQVIIVGGLTGSGKTAILHRLQQAGEQVLDLEELACHRGSAFGATDKSQPSNEQFENLIAVQWAAFDPKRAVWVEGESRQIGKAKIPEAIHKQMNQAPLFLIERPLDERLEIVYRDYSCLDPEYLIRSTERLAKRLGSEGTKQVVEMVKEGTLLKDKKKALEIISSTILRYYDKTYLYTIEKREQPIFPLKQSALSDSEWASLLVKSAGLVLTQTC